MLYNSVVDLKKRVERVHEVRRIVMIPGTFDLFNTSHLKMIKSAKEYPGDFIIVVVKGNNIVTLDNSKPPIICERDRAMIVSNIKGVDTAIIADYDPERLVTLPYKNAAQERWLNVFEPIVSELRPNIFVHSYVPELQYAQDELFKKYGVLGRVIPRTQGINTASVIERVQKLYGDKS